MLDWHFAGRFYQLILHVSLPYQSNYTVGRSNIELNLMIQCHLNLHVELNPKSTSLSISWTRMIRD